MFRIRPILISVAAVFWAGAAAIAAAQGYAADDPPTRVARLAYVAGEVSLAMAGGDNWSVADRNRPLIAGDRLWSGANGRAALDLGGASVRVDHDTALDFAALDDSVVRVTLSQGTLNLGVRRWLQGQSYEVDTPTLAFVPDGDGSFRIDIDPDGVGAMVTIFRGTGTAYGAGGTHRELGSGYSYRFDDADLSRMTRNQLPYGNDFDRFCADLDSEFARSESAQYVADNVIGYDDLDRYGRWTSSSDYGPIWFPEQVAVDWAPYRYGHWAWIDPWGWTWIDDAPWGFAPFHYGRWALVGTRWGWVPGPRLRTAVYAPALVAFVGNVSISVGGPVAWFPLGPRDVYLPPYRMSRNYFMEINLASGRHFTRDRMRGLYGDYRDGRWHGDHRYAYHRTPRAVTSVPGDVFTRARPVARSSERMSEAVLQRATVMPAPAVRPTTESRAMASRALPPQSAQRAFGREVVSRAPTASRTTALPRAMPATAAPYPPAVRPTTTTTTPIRPGAAPPTVTRNAGAVLPRSAPPATERIQPPIRNRAVPSAPSAPSRTQPTLSRELPRAAPSAPVTTRTPVAMPAARPAPARPSAAPITRSVHTPSVAPRTRPATPVRQPARPASQPTTSTPRSVPSPTPMRRATAPAATKTKTAPPPAASGKTSRERANGGVMPRGRPGG